VKLECAVRSFERAIRCGFRSLSVFFWKKADFSLPLHVCMEFISIT